MCESCPDYCKLQCVQTAGAILYDQVVDYHLADLHRALVGM